MNREEANKLVADMEAGKGVEWRGVWINPDAMHQRLIREVITLELLRQDDIDAVNKALAHAQITVTNVDDTGFLAAETPIGRIGSYATMHALFSAIAYAYQQRVTYVGEQRDDLLKAAKRALAVLKAQGESVRRHNVLWRLNDAIEKAKL